jgi:hypothetical protein
MLARHMYRVHREGGEWTVTKDGEDRSRANFQHRERAIVEAVLLARSDRQARVMIDNGDGSITEAELFGRHAPRLKE